MDHNRLPKESAQSNDACDDGRDVEQNLRDVVFRHQYGDEANPMVATKSTENDSQFERYSTSSIAFSGNLSERLPSLFCRCSSPCTTHSFVCISSRAISACGVASLGISAIRP